MLYGALCMRIFDFGHPVFFKSWEGNTLRRFVRGTKEQEQYAHFISKFAWVVVPYEHLGNRVLEPRRAQERSDKHHIWKARPVEEDGGHFWFLARYGGVANDGDAFIRFKLCSVGAIGDGKCAGRKADVCEEGKIQGLGYLFLRLAPELARD